MTATVATGAARMRTGGLRRFASQEALLAVAVIGLAVAVGFINPRFLAYRNIADILLGNAYIAIAAIGMSMVIISGNIDISVGSLIGLADCASRLLYPHVFPPCQLEHHVTWRAGARHWCPDRRLHRHG